MGPIPRPRIEATEAAARREAGEISDSPPPPDPSSSSFYGRNEDLRNFSSQSNRFSSSYRGAPHSSTHYNSHHHHHHNKSYSNKASLSLFSRSPHEASSTAAAATTSVVSSYASLANQPPPIRKLSATTSTTTSSLSHPSHPPTNASTSTTPFGATWTAPSTSSSTRAAPSLHEALPSSRSPPTWKSSSASFTAIPQQSPKDDKDHHPSSLDVYPPPFDSAAANPPHEEGEYVPPSHYHTGRFRRGGGGSSRDGGGSSAGRRPEEGWPVREGRGRGRRGGRGAGRGSRGAGRYPPDRTERGSSTGWATRSTHDDQRHRTSHSANHRASSYNLSEGGGASSIAGDSSTGRRDGNTGDRDDVSETSGGGAHYHYSSTFSSSSRGERGSRGAPFRSRGRARGGRGRDHSSSSIDRGQPDRGVYGSSDNNNNSSSRELDFIPGSSDSLGNSTNFWAKYHEKKLLNQAQEKKWVGAQDQPSYDAASAPSDTRSEEGRGDMYGQGRRDAGRRGRGGRGSERFRPPTDDDYYQHSRGNDADETSYSKRRFDRGDVDDDQSVAETKRLRGAPSFGSEGEIMDSELDALDRPDLLAAPANSYSSQGRDVIHIQDHRSVPQSTMQDSLPYVIEERMIGMETDSNRELGEVVEDSFVPASYGVHRQGVEAKDPVQSWTGPTLPAPQPQKFDNNQTGLDEGVAGRQMTMLAQSGPIRQVAPSDPLNSKRSSPVEAPAHSTSPVLPPFHQEHTNRDHDFQRPIGFEVAGAAETAQPVEGKRMNFSADTTTALERTSGISVRDNSSFGFTSNEISSRDSTLAGREGSISPQFQIPNRQGDRAVTDQLPGNPPAVDHYGRSSAWQASRMQAGSTGAVAREPSPASLHRSQRLLRTEDTFTGPPPPFYEQRESQSKFGRGRRDRGRGRSSYRGGRARSDFARGDSDRFPAGRGFTFRSPNSSIPHVWQFPQSLSDQGPSTSGTTTTDQYPLGKQETLVDTLGLAPNTWPPHAIINQETHDDSLFPVESTEQTFTVVEPCMGTTSEAAAPAIRPVATDAQEGPAEAESAAATLPIREEIPTPPPSEPSGVVLALTRLADLEAQMDYEFAKLTQLMAKQKILRVQYDFLESLPVGLDAFRDDLLAVAALPGPAMAVADLN